MRRLTRTSDEGISLIEVVVSILILSIISAFVASFVAVSLRSITRSESTATAAAIAQEQLDQLLAVPIKQWGYEGDGTTLKTAKTNKDVVGRDGITYTVTRELSQNASDLDVKDACAATVGRRTSRADLVALKLTVKAKGAHFNDTYTTTTHIARDGNATFLKSSVTIRFNVVRGSKSVPYQEGRDGDPIEVHVEDHFRNSKGEGETNNLRGKTKGGCITFLELNGKSPVIDFDLGEYRMPDGKQRYNGKINMISGGHRELVFDISRTAKVRIVPDIVGVPQKTCDRPRLIRMHTPIAAPDNRAIKDLGEIARVSKQEADRLTAIPEGQRSTAEKNRLLSYSKWQYYLVCQGSDKKFQSRDFSYWFLLPDTIPVSVVEEGEVRAVGRWSNTTFVPMSNKPGLEEGQWPIVFIDNPKVGGENQAIFPGSCLMRDIDGRARPFPLTKSFLNQSMSTPGMVHLPLWGMPLEGWYKAKHIDRGYDGYLPLVIKNINDTVPTANMWGDSRIAGLNQNWYAGCKDTPVFEVGWLKDVDLRNNFAQMRLALPYGLYAYSIYGPDETEEVDGKTIPKSRNTCYPQKRSDRYAGERACLPAGANRVTLFQTDVRAAYRPSWWGSGENIYRTRYYDWNDPERGHYPLPRGPILDACEANTGDFRYCPDNSGKDRPDTGNYDPGDDDHPRGQQPGFGRGSWGSGSGSGTSPKPTPPANGGGDTNDDDCWQLHPNGGAYNPCTGQFNPYGIPGQGGHTGPPPWYGYQPTNEVAPWIRSGHFCFRPEPDLSYTNWCTQRRGFFPNGNGNSPKPKEGSNEDRKECWMRWYRKGGYNYCADYYDDDKYD